VPPREWRLRVEDMLEAIDRIDRYTAGLTRDAFIANEMVLDAVLRNLAVLAEAAGHIPSEVQRRLPEVPWAAICGARNVMVHEYFAVDEDVIWDTITRDLPPLVPALRRLLNQPQ
jgi:uncharacterized protein with HEPN domain